MRAIVTQSVNLSVAKDLNKKFFSFISDASLQK